MMERIVAVRRAAMPCEAPSALGSWNATAKLFAAHATTTNGIVHVLLFFRRAGACSWRRGEDGDIRFRYLRVPQRLGNGDSREGESNILQAGQQRFAVWKRTSQCHHGTEEKAPGRWKWSTAAPEGM